MGYNNIVFYSEPVCEQEMETGECDDVEIEEFWYDAEEKECVKFNYGGCGGNNNHFESHQECAHFCGGKQD